MRAIFSKFLGRRLTSVSPRDGEPGQIASAPASTLNYDEAIHLDAEDLAETGLGEAYDIIRPQLQHYVKEPASIQELIDSETGRYSVLFSENEYVIFSNHQHENIHESWGNATYIFLKIINDQLLKSDYKFYALYNGNDLQGIFLRPEDVEREKHCLENSQHWPYLPTPVQPWYGQFH
ncbi:hypothetical protein [Labrys neptuniae]